MIAQSLFNASSRSFLATNQQNIILYGAKTCGMRNSLLLQRYASLYILAVVKSGSCFETNLCCLLEVCTILHMLQIQVYLRPFSYRFKCYVKI